MKRNTHHINIALHFERRWKIFEKWCYSGETLGIHYGYYTNTTRNLKDAVYAMNDLIGDLLDLKHKKSARILDAGCGVGGTSIFLGKKYPNVQFTGITISDGQVEMGQKFIQDRDVSNCNIMKGDFHKTKFPNNNFDGVFAIESVGYSENIEDFVQEMKRVLIPGGILVVLDGFRTEVIINSFLQKIYESFLFGRGYQKLDFPHLKYFIKLLEQKGYTDVYYNDISNHVARSQIRGIIIAIPFFASYVLKKIITLGKYDRKKNYFDFSMGAAIFSPIIALKHISRYYLITAKKEDHAYKR